MTQSSRAIIISRLKNIVFILERQRSGAKIHLATNLLQTAISLLDTLDMLPEKEIHRLLRSVEYRTAELFRNY